MQLLSLSNFIHPDLNAIITMFGGYQKAHNLNVSHNEVNRHAGFSMCSGASVVSYCTVSNNIAHDGIILYFTLNSHKVDHCVLSDNYQEGEIEEGIFYADNNANAFVIGCTFVRNSGGSLLLRKKSSAITVLNTYIGFNNNLLTSDADFLNNVNEFDFINVHFASGNCLANVPYSEKNACTIPYKQGIKQIMLFTFLFTSVFKNDIVLK